MSKHLCSQGKIDQIGSGFTLTCPSAASQWLLSVVLCKFWRRTENLEDVCIADFLNFRVFNEMNCSLGGCGGEI